LAATESKVVAMTHDELLDKIDDIEHKTNHTPLLLGVQTALLTQNKAIRAVVELHEQINGYCSECSDPDGAMSVIYPCPTIQTVEKELA
jgi:hypothetical protein